VDALDAAQRDALAELIRLTPLVDRLGVLFAEAGHELYLVGGSVRDGVVHGIQAERGDVLVREVEQAGADERHHPPVRLARAHPLPAHGDVVPHQPGVGQGMAPRTANGGMVALARAGLLDLAHEEVTTFALDAVNDAVAHAAAHGGPFVRTIITPQSRA
jgi:hypothetical protein